MLNNNYSFRAGYTGNPYSLSTNTVPTANNAIALDQTSYNPTSTLNTNLLSGGSQDISTVLTSIISMLISIIEQFSGNTPANTPTDGQNIAQDIASEDLAPQNTGGCGGGKPKPAVNSNEEPSPAPAPTKKEDIKKNEGTQSVSGAGDSQQQEFLDLMNAERAKHGLKPVRLNNELNKAAKDYSVLLNTTNQFKHDADGSPGDRAKKAGYPSTYVGENIAKGSQNAKDTFEMWMNSPGHRDNILKPEYTEIGLGKDGDVWTQTLGNP